MGRRRDWTAAGTAVGPSAPPAIETPYGPFILTMTIDGCAVPDRSDTAIVLPHGTLQSWRLGSTVLDQVTAELPRPIPRPAVDEESPVLGAWGIALRLTGAGHDDIEITARVPELPAEAETTPDSGENLAAWMACAPQAYVWIGGPDDELLVREWGTEARDKPDGGRGAGLAVHELPDGMSWRLPGSAAATTAYFHVAVAWQPPRRRNEEYGFLEPFTDEEWQGGTEVWHGDCTGWLVVDTTCDAIVDLAIDGTRQPWAGFLTD